MLDFNNPDKYNKKVVINDQEEYVKSTPTAVTDVVESNVQEVLDKNIESDVTEKGDLFSNLRDVESPAIEGYVKRPNGYKEGGVLYQDDVLISPDDQQGTLSGMVDRTISGVTAATKGINDFGQSISRLPEDFEYLRSLQDAQGVLTEQVPTGIVSQNIPGTDAARLSDMSTDKLQIGNELDPIQTKQALIRAETDVARENAIGASKADWFDEMDPMNDMIDVYDKRTESFDKIKRRDAQNLGGEIVDVSTSAIGGMAPGLAISAVNPYAGATYFAGLGAGKYDENRRRGASVADAMGDAGVNAASEVLSDLVLAGALKPVSKVAPSIKKMITGSNSEMEILTKILKKYPVSGNAAKDLAERIVGGGLGEGMESVATQISDDMLIKDKTWDESKIDWKEVAMSAAAGGLIGTALRAPNMGSDIKTGIKNVQEKQALKQAYKEADKVLAYQDEVVEGINQEALENKIVEDSRRLSESENKGTTNVDESFNYTGIDKNYINEDGNQVVADDRISDFAGNINENTKEEFHEFIENHQEAYQENETEIFEEYLGNELTEEFIDEVYDFNTTLPEDLNYQERMEALRDEFHPTPADVNGPREYTPTGDPYVRPEMTEDNTVQKEINFDDEKTLNLEDINDSYIKNEDGSVDYIHTDGSVTEFQNLKNLKEALKNDENLVENEDGEFELNKSYKDLVWKQKGNKLESKSWKATFYPDRNVTVLESKTTKKGKAGLEKLSYVGKKDKLFDKMVDNQSIGETYNQEVRLNKDRYATVFEDKNFKPGTAKATKTKMLGEVYKDIINNNANELNPDGLQYINFDEKTNEAKLVNTALVAAGRNAVFGEGDAASIRETLEYIKTNEANSKSSKAKIDEALNVLDTKKFSNETHLNNALNTTKDKLNDVTDDIKKKHLKSETKKPKPKSKDKTPKSGGKKTTKTKAKTVEKEVDTKLKEKKASEAEVKTFLDKLVDITNDVNYKIDTTIKRIWNKIKDLAKKSGFADIVNDYIFNPKNGIVMAAVGNDGVTGIDGSPSVKKQKSKTKKTKKPDKKTWRDRADAKLEQLTDVTKAKKSLESAKTKDLLAKTNNKSLKAYVKQFEGNTEVNKHIDKFLSAYEGKRVTGLEKKLKKYLREEFKKSEQDAFDSEVDALANSTTKRTTSKKGFKLSDKMGLLSIDGMLNTMGDEYVSAIGDKLDYAENTKAKTFNNRQIKLSEKIDTKTRKSLNQPSSAIEDMTINDALPLLFTNEKELTYKFEDETTKLSKEETAEMKRAIIKDIKDNNLEDFVVDAVNHTNDIAKEVNAWMEESRLRNDKFNNNRLPVYEESEINTFEDIIKNDVSIPVSSSNKASRTEDPAGENSLNSRFRSKYKAKDDATVNADSMMDILYDFNNDASSLMAYNDVGARIKDLLADESVIKNMKSKIGEKGVNTLNKMINSITQQETGNIKQTGKRGDAVVSAASKIFYPAVLAYNFKVALGQLASFPLAAINSDLSNKKGIKKVGDHAINMTVAGGLLAKNIAMRTAGITNASKVRQEFYDVILPAIKLRDDGFTQTMESRDLFKNTLNDKNLYQKLRGMATKGGMSGISMMDMATIDTIIDLYVRQNAKNSSNNAKIKSLLKQVEKSDGSPAYIKARDELDALLAGETESIDKMAKKITKNINRTQPTSDPQYVQDIRKMNEALKFITMFKTQPLQNIENVVVGFKKGRLTGDWEMFAESVIRMAISMAMFTAIGRGLIDDNEELLDDKGVMQNYSEDLLMNTLNSLPAVGEGIDIINFVSGSAAENHPVQQILNDAKKLYRLTSHQFDDKQKKAKRALADKKLAVKGEEVDALEYVDNLRATEIGQIMDILTKYGTGVNVGSVTKSLKQIQDMNPMHESSFEKAKDVADKAKYRTNTVAVEEAFKDAGDKKGLKSYKSMLKYRGKKLKDAHKERVKNR